MKTVILTFSPTGNTKLIAKLISENLKSENIVVTNVDITGDNTYFSNSHKTEYLSKLLPAHDLLIIGAPVYAHHMQYKMLELLAELPFPDKQWGNFALPFITYGGINSGIALEEAAKILKKRKRTIIGGAKFSLKHHALKSLVDVDVNFETPDNEIRMQIHKLIESIKFIQYKASDISKKLCYKSRKEFIIDTIVFNEKKWHRKKYPQISIDTKKCTQCQRCAKNCPVGHLTFKEGAIQVSEESPCIHCTNCILQCPVQAIAPEGKPGKMKDFVQKLIAKGAEQPTTELF